MWSPCRQRSYSRPAQGHKKPHPTTFSVSFTNTDNCEAERFIEQENPEIGQQAAGDLQTPSVTARQFPGRRVAKVDDADVLQHLVAARESLTSVQGK